MKIEFLTKNLGMKFIALILSLALWVFVAASINSVSKFPGSIPVKSINVPDGYSAIYDEKEVSIKIAAPPKIWNQLSSENFSAFVDLNGLSSGTHELKVYVNSNQSEVEIIEIEPRNLMVRLEPNISKKVPVKEVISGQPAEGMSVGGVAFDPAEAEIFGPKSLIDIVNNVTAEVVLSNEDQGFSRDIVLKVLNEKSEAISEISVLPTSVKADIKIVKAGNNKTVGIKVLTSGYPASGFYISNITVDPATVDIVGQDSLLRQTQFIETEVVDITNQNQTLAKSVSLSLPPGISLQRESNQNIKITINFLPTSINREVTAKIVPKNLAAGLKISNYDPPSVKVIVSGPVDQINALAADQVILNIDLLGKNIGIIGFDISDLMFDLPPGIKVISFLPSSLSITLQAE
jgi:YbbR domain-containing protein